MALFWYIYKVPGEIGQGETLTSPLNSMESEKLVTNKWKQFSLRKEIQQSTAFSPLESTQPRKTKHRKEKDTGR